ncbi:glycosyltransferase [bacterium]|nr:glycosyltransferase [bacterium]
MSQVVLQWPSFGPYHTARLRACVEAAPDGVEVIGLAVAGQVQGRPWKPDDDPGGLRVETLFPDAMYHELPGGEVRVAMRKALDDLAPEAVGISGYGMVDSRAALDWARQNGASKVMMTESKEDDAPRVCWKEFLKRRLVGRFDSALCGGTPHRAYLEKLGMPLERIFDRYDVVDNDRFRMAADRVRADASPFQNLPGLEDKRPFFLASSRFIERKNLPRLMTAFADYRMRIPEGWRLVILGTGPDEELLRKQALDEVIPDVTFAGFQQFETLVAYYAMAGAFIHPALQEQWGLVVNEAMACGLPVLCSSTVGACHDLVLDGENGFRFEPGSVKSIRDALEATSSSGDREAMGRRSLEIIADWTPADFARNFWAAVNADQ